MIIKKFQAKTEEEATQLAKKELGGSVVIMNVRSIKRKGFLSLFRKPMVEITAALEDEPDKPVYRPTAKPRTTPLRTEGKGEEEEKSSISINAGLEADIIRNAQEAPARSYSKDSSQSLEEKLESLHLLIEQQMLTLIRNRIRTNIWLSLSLYIIRL